MSYKKLNLPHYLKYNNLEDFEIINNILVDRDSIKIGTRFKQFSNNPPKALRTKVSKTFKNYALKNISYLGINGLDLFKEEMRHNRCHGTTLLFSLCLNNFEWIFGNLKAVGASSLIEAALKDNDALLTTNLAETKDYNRIYPTFNHSFLKIQGYDLIASGIIDDETLKNKFIFNPNENYIVDPTFNIIMTEENYNKFMQPEYFLSLNQDDLNANPLYKLVKTQSKSNNFGYEDYVKLFTQTQINSLNNQQSFVDDVVLNDMFNMIARRNQTINEYKQILLTDLMLESLEEKQK